MRLWERLHLARLAGVPVVVLDRPREPHRHFQRTNSTFTSCQQPQSIVVLYSTFMSSKQPHMILSDCKQHVYFSIRGRLWDKGHLASLAGVPVVMLDRPRSAPDPLGPPSREAYFCIVKSSSRDRKKMCSQIISLSDCKSYFKTL